MIAARSLGLDCSPMSGFDNAKVDAAFFQGENTQPQILPRVVRYDTDGKAQPIPA
jgi:3-hydroxypropanoate dehydrogenase